MEEISPSDKARANPGRDIHHGFLGPYKPTSWAGHRAFMWFSGVYFLWQSTANTTFDLDVECEEVLNKIFWLIGKVMHEKDLIS